jgi:hypothetical protein
MATLWCECGHTEAVHFDLNGGHQGCNGAIGNCICPGFLPMPTRLSVPALIPRPDLVPALMDAAKDLAALHLRTATGRHPNQPPVQFCDQCLRSGLGMRSIPHADDCPVGLALDAIAAVQAQRDFEERNNASSTEQKPERGTVVERDRAGKPQLVIGCAERHVEYFAEGAVSVGVH